MVVYRYVHLSDIHFGQERNGDKIIHEDVRSELLRDCDSFSKTIGLANGILVTGDVAYSGKKEQYDQAGEWLDQLTDSIGCPKTAVSLIPGNHDVDISKIGEAGRIIIQSLRDSPLGTLDARIEALIKEDEANNSFLPKLAAYREFAERYGCGFPSPLQPFWIRELMFEEIHRLSFVGLTSVLVSDLADDLNRLVLGNQQYILQRHSNTELVIMMHHPPEWFRDREKVHNYLRRARVVLVGHEHSLDVHQINHADGETLWIHAGATNSPEGAEPYQYRYNWLEFSIDNGEAGSKLHVRVYPRVWDPGRTKFICDHNKAHGNEYMDYSLACPHYQAHRETAKDIESSLPLMPDNQGEVENKVQESMERTDEPYAKVRYLFWKYLGWRERLSVLVELNLLPAKLDQPIPQTLERMALEKAKSEGKLSKLWEAVMKYVPENQKEANPF